MTYLNETVSILRIDAFNVSLAPVLAMNFERS